MSGSRVMASTWLRSQDGPRLWLVSAFSLPLELILAGGQDQADPGLSHRTSCVEGPRPAPDSVPGEPRPGR